MRSADRVATFRSGKPVIQLLAVTCLTGFVWCWVLPWLSAFPSIRQHLQFLEERGIDPSAMFYTELEAMDPILERLEED